MTPQEIFRAWAVKQVPPHSGMQRSLTTVMHEGQVLHMAVTIEQECDQINHEFRDRDHEDESDVHTLSAKIDEYTIELGQDDIELTEDEISEIEREIVERGN